MTQTTRNMNPFPGLRPFRADEDYLFFGREEQTLELLRRLGSHRFVAVVGTSGSGKSSLVRCGLLSELQGGKMLKAGAAWEIAVTHPGGNPLALLTEALLDADLYDRHEENARENLLATLSRSHFGLVEAVKQAGLGEGTNFLLVVDQFEEVFRFHEAGQEQQEAANEFVSLLLEAVSQTQTPIYVVLTMRSDFIGECGQFEGLAEMVNRGEFLIPRLTRDQYKRVIEGPIKVAGGQIAPRLLQRLLNDLGQQADQLPCLQHALMRTWSVWSERGDSEPLDLDDYQRVGRMSEALSLHADEIYASLADDRQRELCRGIFQALTIQESENRGIRRPQRLGSLSQILDVPADELRPIIDAYRHQGVTFLTPSPEVELTDRTIIDISHESLMRVWTCLRRWVEEEAQAAGIYRRLSESADLYAQRKAGLYRDPELGIALAWRDETRPNKAWAERYHLGFAGTMEFLEASRQASVAEEQAREAARQRELEQAQQLAEARQQRLQQQQRAARKLRALIGGLAVVAAIAGVACVAALFANNKANREAERAQLSAETAQNAQKATQQALTEVEAQKAQVEGERNRAELNLKKAEVAEKAALAAEQRSREFRYATDMQLAATLVGDETANAGQVLARLAAHDPAENAELKGKEDLRGFEWHYLKRLVESRATVVSGFDTPPVDCVLTADGELITLDEEARLQHWDSTTGHAARPPLDLKKGRNVGNKAISPDGKRAAFAIGDEVHVVDAGSGEETLRLQNAATGRGLVFSPDSRLLVTIGGQIVWWDAATGSPIASAESKLSDNGPISISRDGLTLAVGGQSNRSAFSVFRMNPDTREVTVLHDKKSANFGGTRAYVLSPDGQMLIVTQMFDGQIRVYDTTTGLPISRNATEHAASISAIAFNDSGDEMVTAALDGAIKIWKDFRSLKSAETALLGHTTEVTRVFVAPGGKRLVSCSLDQTMRIWDLTRNTASLHQAVEGLGSLRGQFSPDGLLVATTESGAQLRVKDAATGRVVRVLPRSDDIDPDSASTLSAVNAATMSPDSVAFSPDNRLLAAGFGGARDVSFVELWDLDRGERLARLPGTTAIPSFKTDDTNGIVSGLAFSPDGKHLVASFGSLTSLAAGKGRNLPLAVYDVASRQVIRWLEGHKSYCISVTFSRDGSQLASGSYDGTAIIWDARSWKPLHVLDNPDSSSDVGMQRVFDAAFSPDGRLLAMASYEGNVIIWDAATGKQLQTLSGHANGVSAVSFSPDGRTLASGSFDHTVRLWSVATWQEIARMNPGVGFVPRDLAFSPDGSQLLGLGGTAFLWSTGREGTSQTERTAGQLAELLRSQADFQGRIRMLSENLRLHQALELLQRKNPDNEKIAAALAAARANWHASRQEWPQAAQAFDRLKELSPEKPANWLRTPGLMRLATALLHQGRAAEAAGLLTGGAKRRSEDGFAAAVERPGLGFAFSYTDGTIRVTELLAGYPGSHEGIRVGDVVVKIDDLEVTEETIPRFVTGISGKAGTKVRLAVRHSGSDQTEVIELTRLEHISDPATGALLHSLRTAINERLAKMPVDAPLLELRAELAGQWQGFAAQAVDYSAAIEALPKQPGEEGSRDLFRLYRRRGDAHVGLKQWKLAVEDYSRAGSEATADDETLGNQGLAEAEVLAESLLGIDTLSPTSEQAGTQWRYTTDKPAADWNQAGFDDSKWQTGPGAFGTAGTASTRTLWTTPDIWLRRSFEVPVDVNGKSWFLRINCDDSAQVFLNGKLLGKRDGWTQGKFVIHELEQAVRELIVPGQNTLAVQAHNSYSAAYVDVGLYAAAVAPGTAEQRLAVQSISNPWVKLAAAHQLEGNQEAIDTLAERRSAEAGAIGDLFIQGTKQEQDWQRAIALYSKGITADTADSSLLSKRARAYEQVKDWEAAAADWNRAAAGNPEGLKLLSQFRRRLAEAGQNELAAVQREQPRKLLEAAVQADPENMPSAYALAQLLSEISDPQWSVVKPAEARSQGGATMTVLDDGSVLVSGVQPDRDVYEVQAEVPAGGVTAIRLEGLTHDSLPEKGHARQGNVVLTEFEAEVSAIEDPPAWRPIKFSRAWADHAQSGTRIENAIDGRPETSWTTEGHIRRENRTAIFVAESPLTLEPGSRLRIRLRHESAQWTRHQFGRFRLGITSHHDPLVATIADVRTQLAVAYALAGERARATDWAGRALDHAQTHEAKDAVGKHLQGLDEVLANLITLRPSDEQVKLALARNHAQRGTKALDQQRAADALVELKRARELFSQVVARTPQWKVLEPIEMKSAGSATLTLQADGSILASGTNPDRDTYTIVARPGLARIRAVRLEALPDPSLPSSGPGRFPDNGNFHVNQMRVSSGGIPAALTDIVVIHDEIQTHRTIIAGKLTRSNGWSNYPRTGQKNAAVVVTDLKRSPDDKLSIELSFSRGRFVQHNLGRFRLSVTGDETAFAGEQLRWGFQDSELADLDVAAAKAYAQAGQPNEAAAALVQALDGVETREARAKIIDQFSDFGEALASLAKLRPQDVPLQLALARNLAKQGQVSLSHNRHNEAPPQLDQARQIFARLLTENPQPQWIVLTPDEVKSAGGAQLTLQADGSVLASGGQPSPDVYRLTFRELPPRIGGLRLELLPDESLPAGGPGRFPNGNVVLTEIAAKLKLVESGPEQVLHLRSAVATHEQVTHALPGNRHGKYPIAAAIDSDTSASDGWAILPKVGQAHSAVFEFDDGVEVPSGSVLTVTLTQNFDRHQIGRFRLSATGDPGAAQATQLRQDLADSGLAELEVALASAHAQQQRLEESAAGFGRALDLATDLPAAAKVVQDASAHAGVLEILAQQRAADARFHSALARHYAFHGDAVRCQDVAEKARALYERKLEAEPNNSLLAKDLADLLLEVNPHQWTLLKPVQMKSEGGATLTLQPDGSVLAGGTSPERDTYTVTAVANLDRIATIRLEAMNDTSLPHGGPGRFPGNGNFTLNGFGVSMRGAPVPLTSIAVTYSQHDGFLKIIDGSIDASHWSIYPRAGQTHAALVATDIAQAMNQELTFEIACSRAEWTEHNIGRFRLWVSAEPQAIEIERSRLEALQIAAPWPRLGAAYYIGGDTSRSLAAFSRAFEMAPDDAAKVDVARLAAPYAEVFAGLADQGSAAQLLRLGQAKYLAPKRIAGSQFQEAVDVLCQGLEVAPDDVELLTWRAEAHMKLRRWSAAIHDYSLAIQRQTDPGKRRELSRQQAEAQLRLGQSSEGAEVYTQQMLLFPGWDSIRDAYGAQLLAGRPDIARGAASRLYEQLASAERDAYWSGWLVRACTAVPGMVTAQNRERLLTAATKAGGDWTAPMTAAIHYRLGNLKEAEPLLTTAAGRPEFLSLAALLAQDRGETDKARQFLRQAEDWFRRQRAQDVSGQVPANHDWREWGVRVALWREAVRKLAGPRIAELDVLLTKEPQNAAALVERARLLAAAGLPEEALADLAKAGKLTSGGPDHVGLRGRILAALGRTDEALVDLNQAIESAAPDALVYAARGGVLLKQGQVERARSDLEKSLAIEPTAQAAEIMADVLLAQVEKKTAWTVLKPTEMKSEGGATMALLDDGSVFVDGKLPFKDVYTLEIADASEPWHTVRLEAMRDDRLPGGGPGTHHNGEFVLSGLKAFYRNEAGSSESVQVPLRSATATFEERPARDSLTAGEFGWSVAGATGQTQTAYFAVEPGEVAPQSGRLRVVLEFEHDPNTGNPATLGRFRLSTSADPQSFRRERDRLAALKMTSGWGRLALAYRLAGQDADFEKTVQQHPESVGAIGDAFFQVEDWKQALVIYSQSITSDTADAQLLARRAEVHGKLQQWEQARADWQRALELRLDDADLKGRWLETLTAGQQWDDVARELSRQLDAMPEGRASHTPRGVFLRSIIRRGDPVFERLMALRPQDPLLRLHLARSYVVRSDWESAIREYAKAIEAVPPDEEGYEYAAALLVADKRAEYDRFMKQFMEESGGTADPYLAYALARAAAISPTPVAPPEKLAEWAELAVSVERRPWYLHAAGLAYLRIGNREVALKYLQESAATTWHPELNQLALALYFAEGKDMPQARGYLKQAQEWFRSLKPQDGYYPVQDTDWLETQLLLREVKALIDRDADSSRPAPP